MSHRSPILFVQTVDTEEEWDWGGALPTPPFRTRNVSRLGECQSFCESLGLKPTWLINHVAADSRESQLDLRHALARGACEIGAHLHPWSTPPHEERTSEHNSHSVNLPVDLVRRKLGATVETIEARFGVRPRVFRAGRWGMNGSLLRVLAEQGFHTDTSVHPHFADTAFSYESAPDRPYWPSYEDILTRGAQRDLLEMPVTSGFDTRFTEAASRLHRVLAQPRWRRLHLVGLLWRVRLLRRVHVSPELSSLRDMVACAEAAIARGAQVINMYFHSSSLLPGGNPYVRTPAELKAFYATIARFWERLRSRHRVAACTLSEARDLIATGS